MTREEAISELQPCVDTWNKWMLPGSPSLDRYKEAVKMALTALRGPTREQVEKARAGCEYCEKHKINLVRIEMNYNDSPGSPKRLNPTRVPKFCPMCGSPLTDDAVDIVMERLEALKNETAAN